VLLLENKEIERVHKTWAHKVHAFVKVAENFAPIRTIFLELLKTNMKVATVVYYSPPDGRNFETFFVRICARDKKQTCLISRFAVIQ
jgi:hypothetical protein